MSINTSIFQIRKLNISKYCIFSKEKIQSLFVIEKYTIAKAFFYLAILIVVFGSLNPWFMWAINRYYYYIAFIPVVICFIFNQSIQKKLFTRDDWHWSYLTCLLASIVIVFVNDGNIIGFLRAVVSTAVFYAVFRLDQSEVKNLADFLAKVMACLMCVSIPFYIMFLMRIPLPHYHISNDELLYSYENYIFFLLDDRFIMSIIPRFHSVFLEPGHLGTACAFLLLVQINHWRKWYNIVLFITTLMTFSLAAYVLLIMIMFLSAWMRRKAILGKIVILLAVLATTVTVSLLYNKGDNMVNMLIVQRLTIDDNGKLSGDNRVTETFEKEFDKFIVSDDVMFGREFKLMKYGWGNSGYRVFIYDNGLISLFFILAFYISFSVLGKYRRGIISMWIIFIASFIVRATPLNFYYFLPLFLLTRLEIPVVDDNEQKLVQDHI